MPRFERASFQPPNMNCAFCTGRKQVLIAKHLHPCPVCLGVGHVYNTDDHCPDCGAKYTDEYVGCPDECHKEEGGAQCT